MNFVMRRRGYALARKICKEGKGMTREEAIKNLEMISVAFVEPVTEEQRKLIDDTFEMAIKALEQEPCDDAISRQAVLDVVNNPLNVRLDEIIKHLPSVTQEPKTDVLDKIRAEIEHIEINGQVDAYTSFGRTGEQVKQMALNIIDKYLKEYERSGEE